jgi:hypothetical protein
MDYENLQEEEMKDKVTERACELVVRRLRQKQKARENEKSNTNAGNHCADSRV